MLDFNPITSVYTNNSNFINFQFCLSFLRMLSTDKSATEGMMNTQITLLVWVENNIPLITTKAKMNLTTRDQQI